MGRTLKKYNSLRWFMEQPECKHPEYIQDILRRHNAKMYQELFLCQDRIDDIKQLIMLRDSFSPKEAETIVYLIANWTKIKHFKRFGDDYRLSICLYVCENIPNLTSKRIKEIFNSNKNRAYYKYSNRKLIELLNITDDEEKEMQSIKHLTKRAARAQESKIRKENIYKRNAKIRRMFKNGKSISEISRKIGLSRRQIHRIIDT